VNPGDAVQAQMFWSNRQVPRPATYLLVRTTGAPSAVAGAMRARLKAFDPTLQVTRVQSMRDWLAVELVRPRFGAVLLGAFGLVALILAAIGTYGLLAYVVAQETHQIGVRVALGAKPSAIVGEVLGRGMKLAGIAVAIGLAGALALTRLLGHLLAGVKATDPLTLGGSVLVLLAVAALACVVPARRASRVDPMVALRSD
jgi:ABC-type antimicrobial peptide transport system permease subunit